MIEMQTSTPSRRERFDYLEPVAKLRSSGRESALTLRSSQYLSRPTSAATSDPRRSDKLCLSCGKRQLSCLATWIVVVGCLLATALATTAANLEELAQKIQNYRFGQDDSALTEIQQLVTAATANKADTSAREQLAKSLATVLDTNASFEAKQFVCRQLAIIGTPKQVPVLARMLTDDKYADMARYASGTNR